MNKFLSILLVAGIALSSCNSSQEKPENQPQEPLTDNPELATIYEEDLADRRSQNIDWSVVSKRDSLREVRIYELLDSNKVRTSKDYHHAAMIFQHGRDSVAYGMAVKLMRKSVELDSNANKWLLAAAIDRHLLSINKPQIYGTQYNKVAADAPWQLSEMDTTQISDAERIAYGVRTLKQQRERVKQMNSKPLSELLAEGKTVDEVIAFIQSENKEESKYDLSEGGINSLGYAVLEQGDKEDALKIFKLNTELYPEGYNTYDSYGECLLALGRKEEGLKAYEKSLELNPKNDNAREVIEKNK